MTGFYSLDTKDKLLTFIEKLRGEKRKNPFSGGKTFGSLPLLDRVWDREKEAMKVVEYLKEALSSDRKLESRGFSATMAARGCGKSLMVDYIQDLHDKKLPKNEAKENEAKENEAKDEEEYWLGELNARLIPIRISFNGEQQLDSEENDALNSPCSPSFSPKIACFLRMIHSGFFDTEAFAWGGFLSEVRKMGNLQDIEMVALHDSLCDFFASHVPQPIFFLAIDEVLRVGEGSGVEEGQIRGVLTAAKSLLDHDSTMWRLFVTTFDDHLVQDQPSLPSLSPSLSSSSSSSLSSLSPRDGGNGGEEKILHREYTGSSRPIVWIPLPPLRIPEEKWQRLTWMKSRRNSNGARELQYLLAVMGGHPRSLRFLYDEMEIHPEASCLDTLDGVWQRFRRWVTNYDDEVWQDLLERALRGDEINTDAAIGRSSLSVMTLLQRSVLLNDVEPDQPFTPHLSLLSLRHWCSTNQEGSHRVVKILLARLTELGMTLNWITFEIFISLFEQLRSWAFSQQLKKKKKSDNVTLFQYWKGAKLLKGSNPVLSFQAGSPKEQTPVLPLLSNCQEPIGNGHYLAAVGQPGFDAMIVKEKVVMFIESRFSENEATTTLCRDKDVYEKVSLLRKEISECPVNVGTAKLSDCRCVFVLVTHRKAPGGNLTKFIALVKEGPKNDDEKEKGEKEKKEKEKKKENYQSFAKFEGTILLMDKDCLETHLGLTFAQLGGFWLSLSSKNNCVNTSIKQVSPSSFPLFGFLSEA